MRPTVTRSTLRRSIAIELMMPFALRYMQGYLNPSNSSTSEDIIIDNKLNQPNDYWNNSWVYAFSDTTEGISLIKDYGINQLLLESKLPFIPNPSISYEIHSIFNAIEIHNAINRSISEGYPAFYDESEESQFVATENILDYPLNLFTNPVEMVLKVEIEQPIQKKFGTVNDLVNWTFTDPNMDMSDINTSWLVSFYGNMNGQVGRWTTIFNVVSATKTITVSSINGFSLANGMKFMVWNPNYQSFIWYPMQIISTDRKEWATRLRFGERLDGLLGNRIRVRFSTVPPLLTSESSATVVPREYIIPKSVSILAASRINDNRVDRQRYAAIAQQKAEEAEIFKRNNFFRRSDVRMWMESDPVNWNPIYRENDNPLNWR